MFVVWPCGCEGLRLLDGKCIVMEECKSHETRCSMVFRRQDSLFESSFRILTEKEVDQHVRFCEKELRQAYESF